MKLLGRAAATFDHALNILLYAAAGLILVCLVAVCTEVLMRYFLNRPLIWVVEVTEYTILYTTFLAAARLLKEEGHVKIELVVDALKPRAQALLNAITSMLGIVVCLVLVFFGTWSTVVHFREDIPTFTAMEIPKWPFLMIIPFGSFLLLIQFVRRAYEYWEKAVRISK